MKHGFEYKNSKKMSFSANNGGNIPKQLSDFVNAKPWCKDMYDMCIALAYVSNLDALFEEARLWHEDIHCHVFKKKSFYAAMTHSNFATAKENFNHTVGFRQRQLMWYDPGIGEIAIFFRIFIYQTMSIHLCLLSYSTSLCTTEVSVGEKVHQTTQKERIYPLKVSANLLWWRC